MTLSELFENDNSGFFDTPEVITYKGWTIQQIGYGYTVRNSDGYISLETSKHGTVDDCKAYIDNALSFKAVN